MAKNTYDTLLRDNPNAVRWDFDNTDSFLFKDDDANVIPLNPVASGDTARDRSGNLLNLGLGDGLPLPPAIPNTAGPATVLPPAELPPSRGPQFPELPDPDRPNPVFSGIAKLFHGGTDWVRDIAGTFGGGAEAGKEEAKRQVEKYIAPEVLDAVTGRGVVGEKIQQFVDKISGIAKDKLSSSLPAPSSTPPTATQTQPPSDVAQFSSTFPNEPQASLDQWVAAYTRSFSKWLDQSTSEKVVINGREVTRTQTNREKHGPGRAGREAWTGEKGTDFTTRFYEVAQQRRAQLIAQKEQEEAQAMLGSTTEVEREARQAQQPPAQQPPAQQPPAQQAPAQQAAPVAGGFDRDAFTEQALILEFGSLFQYRMARRAGTGSSVRRKEFERKLQTVKNRVSAAEANFNRGQEIRKERAHEANVANIEAGPRRAKGAQDAIDRQSKNKEKFMEDIETTFTSDFGKDTQLKGEAKAWFRNTHKTLADYEFMEAIMQRYKLTPSQIYAQRDHPRFGYFLLLNAIRKNQWNDTLGRDFAAEAKRQK